MDKNVLVSFDASFTRTGICIILLKEKEIYFDTTSCKIGEKNFINTYTAARTIANSLQTIVSNYTDDPVVIMESPLPLSSMSSALYCLDTLIYDVFYPNVAMTYNPATLRSRIHRKKYTKHDSIMLAKSYLETLKTKGFQVKSLIGTKKVIPHDCAEALLYAHTYLKDIGLEDFQFDNSEQLKSLKRKEKEIGEQDERELFIR